MMLLAAPLATLGGCEDKPVKKPDVVVEPTPAKEVAPSGPVDKLEAPDSVVIYGGVDKATEMAGHVSELILGTPTQGATQLESGLSAMALRFGLKDAKALDVSKPVRFAVIDPKANKQPFCIAVGVKSRADFEKSLPAKHKKDDQGNGFTYSAHGGDTVFVNYVDDWAVFTGEKDVFSKNKAFVVKLIGSTVKGDAGAIIDVGHLTKIFGTEMEQAFEQMKQSAGAAPSPVPMAGGVDKMVDWMKTLSTDLDKVVVSTNASKEAGSLQFDVIAKSGSELEKTIKTLGARKLEPMMALLPKDAPAALVASFDPDKATDLMRGMVAWSMQLTLGDKGTEKDYSDALNEYWKGSNGEMALVAHTFDGQIRLSMINGVRDAEKVRTSMTTLRGMYNEKKFKELYESLGVEYAFKKDAYKVGDVSVDSVTAKVKEKKKDAKPSPMGDMMGPGAGMFAKLMSHDYAVTDKLIYSVYGGDQKKVMEAWIGGKVEGGLDKAPGMQRAMKGAAPGTFFMLYGSPLAVASALQAGDKAPPPAAPGEGIAISAGSTGGVLHIKLDVPSNQAQSMMKMLGGMRF